MAGRIRARGLKKAYLPKSGAWRRLGAALLRRLPSNALWALQGVDLDAAPGEVLGLMGPNGSGKSTLLRILAGASDPDEGELVLEGRVGSLLDLGAGLHPEFKGADNARLQGRLRDLDGDDLDRYVAAVQDFCGLGEAWELPCKGYSSGMKARLGFACAVSVDPDVLLVDEALGVGDEAFQSRCLQRIQGLLAKGSTVVLATHDRAMLQAYCGRALVLDQGRVAFAGPVVEALALTKGL